MASDRLRPENLEERLVFWALTWTWGLWLLGAGFVVFPLLGWTLAAIAMGRRLGWLERPDNFVARPSPVIVSAWLAGMALMLVTLIMGQIDFDFSAGATFKSTLGWVKGWALLAVFPLAGAMTHIRPQIVIRAMNILGLQTLLITPFLIAGALAGTPVTLYVSPLHLLIGSDAIFYDVGLYSTDGGVFGFRLRFFTPWAPAAAFFGVIAFVVALYDRHPMWRMIGALAALIMCVFSLSRLALVAIPVVLIAIWLVTNALRPVVLGALAVGLALGLIFIDPILDVIRDAEAAFTSARADSSRVRATIQRMGLHRWETEAYWFGHGGVEQGPHLIEYMAIGSHHTWIGLLFVKGLLGFLAALLPLVWTILELAARAQRDRVARCTLGCMMAVVLFSFGENLESLAYLIWPAFLLVGITAKRRISFAPSDREAAARLKDFVPRQA
jgi:O-Antigen ligase